MTLRLASVVQALGGELHGDANLVVEGLAPLESAGPAQLSFLSHPKYQHLLSASHAGCVIVSPQFQALASARGACIVTDQPYLYYARVTQLWKKTLAVPIGPLIHPSAVIDPQARIHSSAHVGPLCVVEAGAVIGAQTVLKSRVTLGEGCAVGERCILHAGVVIGADGFGFAPNAGAGKKLNSWVRCVSAMTWKLAPTPALTAAPCKTP